MQFIIPMLLSVFALFGDANARVSFETRYESSDIKINIFGDILRVCVAGKSKECDLSTVGEIKVAIGASSYLKLSQYGNGINIWGINCPSSIAIDSNKNVYFTGYNNVNNLFVKSTGSIVNCSRLGAMLFCFYSSIIFNCGGINDSNVKIPDRIQHSDFTRHMGSVDSGFFNFGSMMCGNVNIWGLNVFQHGEFRANSVEQNDGNFTAKSTGSKSNVKTQIGKISGTDIIEVIGNSKMTFKVQDLDPSTTVNVENGELKSSEASWKEFKYSSGKRDRRCPYTPHGIVNICNTCYLNACIQLLYSIDYYRWLLINYSGNDEFISALVKLMKLLSRRLITKEDIDPFIQIARSYYDTMAYNFVMEEGKPGSCVSTLLNIVSYLNKFGQMPYPFVSNSDDSIVFSLKTTKLSSIKYLNGGYVIITDELGGDVQLYDDIMLCGNRFSPIVWVLSNDQHYVFVVKISNGKYIYINDHITQEVDALPGGFNSRDLVVFKLVN